jgi:NTP pyrophosphatase (non-canonical NTP hydrolase)
MRTKNEIEHAIDSLEVLKEIYNKSARQHGFWDLYIQFKVNDVEVMHNLEAVKLCLIHSEVSEALEELRLIPFNKDKFTEELVDVLIRTLDLAGEMRLDIVKVMKEKRLKNDSRPYKHNKLF